MSLKIRDKDKAGRGFSPARKALSRSGLGLCRSPRRGLSTSFNSSKPSISLRPGARPRPRPGVRGVGGRKSSANVKVVVRVRPLSQRETTNNARVILDVMDQNMVVFDPKREEENFFFHGTKQRGRDMLKKENKNTQYIFDRVFGPEATNEDVFEGSTKTIVTSVLDGFNSSVFVYGATGAGKTFTMLGTQENPGITFRTMVELFQQMENQSNEKSFNIGVSYLEVYNETVRDLLNPSSGPLHLREDAGGVVAAGLKIERISDPNRMFELLEQGNQNRSQHPTDANAESSRSHAVFQVYIQIKTKATAQQKKVKLSMIDLAGSERGAATGCSGVRFKEGSNINKSLLALGNVINALADGLNHIPYRDSKLTRLLKDSLGGNCQTVMIANVSPAHPTLEDTHNTLKYATRAKCIKCEIKRNIVSVELHVSHYIKMVEDLQAENERLKSENESLKSELKSQTQPAATTEDTVKIEQPPAQGTNLPPVLAAAVASISSKLKPAVSTMTVGVNTSPLKELTINENFKRLTEEAEKLYVEKVRLHQRYLNMNLSDKVLRWRIKMKQRTIDRVLSMSSTPTRTDQAQIKVDKSVKQFRGRLTSVNECQDEVSVEEREINQRLERIHQEVQRLGIMDEVTPHLRAFELEFLNQELNIKCQHLEKLVEYLDTVMKSQEDMVKKVSSLFRTYYKLVRGHGHMDDDLSAEHEAVMQCLQGMKTVQWKQENEYRSPADDSKAVNVTLKSIAHVPFSLNEDSTSLTVLSDLASNPDTTASSSVPIQNEKEVPAASEVLQSPVCSSSSNQPIISNKMDTASMLDSLGDLESKVESILNTSISSTAAEFAYDHRSPAQEDKEELALNVTFDGESNLNSTFTRDNPPEIICSLNETFPTEAKTKLNETFPTEAKVNLNETFEKPDDCENALPTIAGDLNGTFSLEKAISNGSSIHTSDPTPAPDQETLSLPQLPQPSGSALSKRFGSPANASPRLKAPSTLTSRSPSYGVSKMDSISPTPASIASISKKYQISPIPSSASQNAALLKKSSSTASSSPPTVVQSASLSKKLTGSTSSLALPNTVKPNVGIKRPIASIIDKRKALGSNFMPPPASRTLSINRKALGFKSTAGLNTPSKERVKLAMNKENTSTFNVRPRTTIKLPNTARSTKPISKPPIPLNDTFTK